VQRCTWIIVIKQDGSGQELPNRVSRDACKRPQEVILQEELSANWLKRKEVVEAVYEGALKTRKLLIFKEARKA